MKYSIKEAKETILCNIDRFQTDSKELLRVAVNSLNRCGDDSSPVSSRLNDLLNNFSILDDSGRERWAENVYIAVVAMKRKDLCKQEIKQKNGKIDGETAQWITTAVQGVLGVASVVFTVLFALGIIPKDSFGELGENSDAFYYLIGTICQQVVAFVIAIVIGLWNRCVIRKKYANQTFTFEELMSVKYEGKPVKFLIQPVTKMLNVMISIFNFGGQTMVVDNHDGSKPTESNEEENSR